MAGRFALGGTPAVSTRLSTTRCRLLSGSSSLSSYRRIHIPSERRKNQVERYRAVKPASERIAPSITKEAVGDHPGHDSVTKRHVPLVYVGNGNDIRLNRKMSDSPLVAYTPPRAAPKSVPLGKGTIPLSILWSGKGNIVLRWGGNVEPHAEL